MGAKRLALAVSIALAALGSTAATFASGRLENHPVAADPPAAAPATSAATTPDPSPDTAESVDASDALTPPVRLPPTPSPSPSPPPPPGPPPGFVTLGNDLTALAGGSGVHVAIDLVELGGSAPQSFSLHSTDSINAASTYKLPVLMYDAQAIATGGASAGDQICYQDGDWADGWFADYTSGACYSRQDLAYRAAHYSDNTAAHMLLRDLGGTAALGAWARSAGATGSAFFEPNTTTANDLAHLWLAEQAGRLGGAAAQNWLYPLLTHTELEAGIPAGLPAAATVIHKTGSMDTTENDAALVEGAPAGPYVLVVLTDGVGIDEGLQLIADVSARVWTYESSRG